MTINEIHEAVCRIKAVSRPALYNYLNACAIEPLGARQRPQQYPPDAADRILMHLGIGVNVTPADYVSKHARIPSMRELKNERSKAQKGRRK